MIKIPTDNLYKFVAISGLVIFSIGSILFYNTKNEIDQATYFIDLSQDVLNRKEVLLENMNEESLKILKDETNKTPEEYDSWVQQEIKNILLDLGLENSIQNNKIKVSGYLILLGLILMLLGFLNWYFKLQIYIDRYYKNNYRAREGSK